MADRVSQSNLGQESNVESIRLYMKIENAFLCWKSFYLGAHAFDNFSELLHRDLARRMPGSEVAKADTRHCRASSIWHNLCFTREKRTPPIPLDRFQHLRVIIVAAGYKTTNTSALSRVSARSTKQRAVRGPVVKQLFTSSGWASQASIFIVFHESGCKIRAANGVLQFFQLLLRLLIFRTVPCRVAR